MPVSLTKRPLADRIGTTFRHRGWTIRLDVVDDYDARTDDYEGLTAHQLAAYEAGDWNYVGILATASIEGVELGRGALFGIERGWWTSTDEDDNITEPPYYLDVYDEAVSYVITEAIADGNDTLHRLISATR